MAIDPDLLTKANQALNRTKIALMESANSAFFATLAFSLKHSFDEKAPTAFTDGINVKYNPAWFASMPPDERLFLMLHETLHVAYLHTLKSRIGTRTHNRWNYAADHVINLQLIERGYKMPSIGGLADPLYKGLNVEQVYDRLPDYPNAPKWDDLKPSDINGQQEIASDVQDILVRASIASKMAGDKPGTIPGEIELFINNLLDPKLPWNRILQKYLMAFAKNDYTFKKPARRYFPKHYMPSMLSQNLMNMAIAVDISGSVSDSDFKRFVSEIASIFRMMKPELIQLIQFDTEIKSVDTIKSIQDLMKVKFAGRGGTDIDPVMKWCNENKPQLLMVFTDGEFRTYTDKVTTETIWLIHNNKNFTTPYGKVIHYEI